MAYNLAPVRTPASRAPALAPPRPKHADFNAVDAASALDVLEDVLETHSDAADPARGDKLRDPNMAQDCLVHMGAPRHVARRASSRDLRALYLGRYPPVRLTLGAAVVLYVAQRWASIGTTPEQILSHAHDAAHRVANLASDRSFRDLSWGEQ
jgi:hypothetical protein